MKTLLPLPIFLLLTLCTRAQITTPIIKAGFGVDGDLDNNYFKGFIQSGNDDWFSQTAGTGSFVIDTNGAAAIVKRYLVDPAYRKLPFFRTMRVPQLSIVNNKLWLDAIYIRDYNGQAGGDSTAFVSSNKNAQSPGIWTGGVTSVLDKNDISDMFIHVRRAGPNKTDSLWLFGGLSVQGTTGNRYFDFELYQTDIFYSRSTGRFTGYGPDAGHTSWTFDAAGNILTPGDIILSEEFQSGALSNLQARIWVNASALSLTPKSFSWAKDPTTGKLIFDGATSGSQFGYAAVQPKTTGDYYTGLDSKSNTWAGPFGFITSGNSYVTDYAKGQFMEFSVNLSKLGLDPITLLGGSACGLPFRRILVKTRTSTSFTSELSDFIGPFDFFSAPPVQAAANVPLFCGVSGVSKIWVTNALDASVYTWQTPDGHILTGNVADTITVDKAGSYVVTQQLLDGCSSFASDTVVITHDATCIPLSRSLLDFTGAIHNRTAQLRWVATSNGYLKNMTLQRSVDGKTFKDIYSEAAVATTKTYAYADAAQAPVLYYRLMLRSSSGTVTYSNVVRLQSGEMESNAVLYPNPATASVQVAFYNAAAGPVQVTMRNAAGASVYAAQQTFSKGHVVLTIDAVRHCTPGLYLVGLTANGKTEWLRCVVAAKDAGEMK